MGEPCNLLVKAPPSLTLFLGSFELSLLELSNIRDINMLAERRKHLIFRSVNYTGQLCDPVLELRIG